jgi:intein/homing endonuclease
MAYTREQFNQFVKDELASPPSSFPWAPTIGLGLSAGAFGAGFIRTKSGKKVWDVYFQALRHLEGTIPMGLLQTFHFSEAISPFAAPQRIDILAGQHKQLFKSRGFRSYLSHATGRGIGELERAGAFTKGLFWQRKGHLLGDLRVRGGPILASNIAAISTGARRGGFLVEWLSHVMGVKDPSFFKNVRETSNDLRPEWLFAGGGKGRSRIKLAGRYAYAGFSSLIGRMNLLLKSPFDLEVMEDLVKKVPLLKKLNLGVKQGPAHKVLLRYAKKGALALGAYKALDYGDYLGRKYGTAATIPFGAAGGALAGLALSSRRGGWRKTAIGASIGAFLGLGGEGPISSIAGLYAKTRISQAKLSDRLGLAEGARRAEDFFPGLTEPATLVAAGGLGLLLGGTKDWVERLSLIKAASAGKAVPKAGAAKARSIYEQIDKAIEERRRKLYDFHKGRAAKQTGIRNIISQLKARNYGRLKDGKFIGAGAGRTAMLGIAAYETLNIAGSAIAGDYKGALFQTAAVGLAGYGYLKRGGALGLGILAAASLLREKEDPEKLKRIYRGEEKVPIKAGRWWESGSTSYEGKRPHYRPHRVALIRSGADKTAMFGSEETFWSTDPLLHPGRFLLDPYAREKLMWEQGYKFPVSKTPFEDTPILGPILAATIGRILKPPKFMGRDQWIPEEPEVGPGGLIEEESDPIMRTGIEGTIGEQLYRLTEAMGLPGFALSSLKERLTGKETFFEKDQWATPSLVSGTEPSWWSLELGGMGLLCIPEGSPVVTENGVIPIEEVCINDKVFSRDSKFHKVVETSSRKADEIIKVSTSCFNTSFEATPNHVLPVYEFYPCHDKNVRCCIPYTQKKCERCTKDNKNVEVVDKPLSEVKKNDFLEVPLPVETYSNTIIDISNDTDIIENNYIYIGCTKHFAEAYKIVESRKGDISREGLHKLGIPDQFAKEALLSYQKNHSVRRYKRFIELDSDLSYILGWYTAEGSIRNTTTQFTLNINKYEFAEEIGLLCKAKFGASFSIYQYPEKSSLVLQVFSPILSRLAKNLIGCGSHEKQVSPLIYCSSINIRAEWLRGYILGDRFFNKKKGKSGITTVSRNLAVQSFLTGISLGLRGYVYLDYLEKAHSYYPQGDKRKDAIRHCVVWTKRSCQYIGDFLNADIDIVSFKGSNKGSFVHDNKLYVQVKEIEYIHSEFTVYDLSIEGFHYFTAQFISVHNSESIRRYIPHNRSTIDYKNPLPSDLPSWLPGPDSNYFLDFSKASIYSEIKDPQVRLPGKGMATLYPELRGIQPEQYSDYWRFMVLSDVAPWSQEYSQYNKIMSQSVADGRLTAEQTLQVHTARKQVQDMKKAKEFSEYKYDSEKFARKTVRITEEMEPGVYLTDSFGSAPITLAGIDTSAISLGSVSRSRDASLTSQQAMQTGLAKRAQISDFLRDYIYPGAEVDVFVNKDLSNLMERSQSGAPIVPAVVSAGGININRELVEQGLAESMNDGQALGPSMATDIGQRAFGSLWEGLTHGAETPIESFIPFAPIAKFVHQRSALEEYQRSEVYGRDVALWQKPIRHFLAPGLSTTAWWAGWRGLPREIQEKYMVEEYFDRLENEKWSRLERQASAEGSARLAAQYQRNTKGTKTGADIFSEHKVRRALSTTERIYFNEFVRSSTSSERKEISRVVSPQMNEILHAQWSRRAAEGARMRIEAGISEDSDLATINRFEGMRRNYHQISNERRDREILSDAQMPGPNWVGFDKNADIEDYKVKTILDRDMDTSHYGIWSSDIKTVEKRPWVKPGFNNVVDRQVVSTSAIKRRFNTLTNRQGGRSPYIYPRAGGHNRIQIDSPGYDRLDRYLRDPSIMQF